MASTLGLFRIDLNELNSKLDVLLSMELASRFDSLVVALEHLAAAQEAIAAMQMQILTHTKRTLKLEALLMTKAEDIAGDVTSLRTAMDTATDEIAKDLDELRRKLDEGLAGGLSAAEADTLRESLAAQFGPLRDRLVELGKDPQKPVPPAVP